MDKPNRSLSVTQSVSKVPPVTDGEPSLVRTMVANLGWLGAQKVFVILLGVAATGVVARHLGPQQTGLLASAQALAAFFGIAAMGVDATVFTSHLHRHAGRESAIMGGTTLVLAASGLISWLLLIFYLWLFETRSSVLCITAGVVGLRMLVTFPAPLALWFQSRLATREVVLANTSGAMAFRAWQFLSSSSGWGVIKIAAAEVISLIVIGLISLRSYFRHGGDPFTWKADWHAGWSILRDSLPALVAAGLGTLLSRLDVLMLRSMTGEVEVGYFNAAASITESLLFVSGMMTIVFAPVLVKTFHQSREAYAQQRLGHLRLCSLLGWSLAAALGLGSTLVISVVFGASYQPSAAILGIHGLLLIPAMLGSAVQCHLTIESRLRWLTLILFVALAIAAILNTLFIPLWGARGAAAASVLASALAYTVVPALLPQTRKLARDTLSALLVPIPRRRDLRSFQNVRPRP